MEEPGAPITQELNFCEHDLIESPTTDTSATDTSATDTPAEDEPIMQGYDPAVMYVEEEELNRKLAKLPFPPLPATLRKWRQRQASPAMMEYIQKIREQKVLGQSNYKIYLPYNLRDKLIAMRNCGLAVGPYCNRKLLIDEYRLKQQRKQWGSPV